MTDRLRIAMCTGMFPVVSETFIVRQIGGLLDLGHEVQIFADTRGDADQPRQPEVQRWNLLQRTTWMDIPPESAPWEMPAWPPWKSTWLPGSNRSIHNLRRLARALPVLARCLTHSPRLTKEMLNPREYSYRAASLSGLYRLAALSGVRRHFEVVHAHFGPVGNSFRFAGRLFGAPLVVSFHGYDFSSCPRREGSKMYERLFATADAITVASNYSRSRLEGLGCPSSKIHRLPLGLDMASFAFRRRVIQRDEPWKILCVGRLVPIKGHADLLQAVARLHREHPAIECHLVGDGPLRQQLQELVVKLGLQQVVIFHGALSSTEVDELMGRTHIFVLASANIEGDEEGQGLVLQEAQATGLPVIATRHGAFPEGLLPERSGFLVPERDPEALAKQLHEVLSHPEQWEEMGWQGRRFVEQNYSIGSLSEQLVELYRSVCMAARGQRQP